MNEIIKTNLRLCCDDCGYFTRHDEFNLTSNRIVNHSVDEYLCGLDDNALELATARFGTMEFSTLGCI